MILARLFVGVGVESYEMRSFFLYRGLLVGFFLGVLTLSGLMAQAQEEGKRPVSDLTKEILSKLTEEERRGLRAAVNEIWQADEVKKRREAMLEANLAYRETLQAEIGEMDVSDNVRSILTKLLQSRFEAEGKVGEGAGVRNPRVKPLEYSAEERRIITNARLRAEKLPRVIEVKRKLEGALTGRDRNVAAGNYRRVMRAAMEKIDPRVKEILAKRERPRGQGERRERARED